MLNKYSKILENKAVCADYLNIVCQQQPHFTEERIPSYVPLLDEYLQGGLPKYALTECGMPLGYGGRALLLKFVAHITTKERKWVLWITREDTCLPYPPAVVAQGIDLQYVRFTVSEAPVIELKSVFLERFFDMIVLDHPGKLRPEDCAFLSRQARQLKQTIVIVRNYLLGKRPSNAHVWATLRFNCYLNTESQGYQLDTCRGLRQPSLFLPMPSS